ncbi:MAG: hypothetical protein Kow0068_09170 [Marinilabiliales bacterium]
MKKQEPFVCGIEKTCPLVKELKHCPFEKFKDMNMNDILDYFENSSNTDVEILMGHYRNCIHLKSDDRK